MRCHWRGLKYRGDFRHTTHLCRSAKLYLVFFSTITFAALSRGKVSQFESRNDVDRVRWPLSLQTTLLVLFISIFYSRIELIMPIPLMTELHAVISCFDVQQRKNVNWFLKCIPWIQCGGSDFVTVAGGWVAAVGIVLIALETKAPRWTTVARVRDGARKRLQSLRSCVMLAYGGTATATSTARLADVLGCGGGGGGGGQAALETAKCERNFEPQLWPDKERITKNETAFQLLFFPQQSRNSGIE